MRNHCQLLLQIVLIGLTQPFLLGQNFIFDFNGVLMGTNTVASLKKIGFGTVFQCALHLKKGPSLNDHLKSKFFEILDKSAQFHQLDDNSCQSACDEQGNPLPYLMRAWLDGSMTGDHIKKHALYAIAKNPEWFYHPAEKRAITNLINTIFTPEQFVETRIIHKNCIAFIKACKKQGHRVYGLSNWDKESFVLLQQHCPEVFNLFDGIIISGDVNTLKPSPDIYTILLNRYNLQPHSCWFIDDQQENIDAATALGINGILCTTKKFSKKPDFHNVTHTIKTMALAKRHSNESCEKEEVARS